MPAIRRGKQGGINQFLKGRKSYQTTYTMRKSRDDYVTFELWIIVKYRKGKRNKYGIEYLAYVVYKADVSLNYIQTDYRKRFGIESSYRIKNICRIKTTIQEVRSRKSEVPHYVPALSHGSNTLRGRLKLATN